MPSRTNSDHYHLTPYSLVGYAPTHDIYQGMEEAIEWYIENINNKEET